jgi:hypothetical protein
MVSLSFPLQRRLKRILLYQFNRGPNPLFATETSLTASNVSQGQKNANRKSGRKDATPSFGTWIGFINTGGDVLSRCPAGKAQSVQPSTQAGMDFLSFGLYNETYDAPNNRSLPDFASRSD